MASLSSLPPSGLRISLEHKQAKNIKVWYDDDDDDEKRGGAGWKQEGRKKSCRSQGSRS